MQSFGQAKKSGEPLPWSVITSVVDNVPDKIRSRGVAGAMEGYCFRRQSSCGDESDGVGQGAVGVMSRVARLWCCARLNGPQALRAVKRYELSNEDREERATVEAASIVHVDLLVCVNG